MTGSPCPAIVLGTGLTALGVLRNLGRARIPCFHISDDGDMARCSRWSRPLPSQAPAGEGHQLGNTLEKLPLARAVLLPCNDDWLMDVATLPASIRRRFPASIPAAQTLALFVDKRACAEALDHYDIPHPRTIAVEEEADLGALSDDELPRFFLKPRNSHLFGAAFGAKAFAIADRGDAAGKLMETREAGLGVVLQEYIPGPADAHYFIDGFVDRLGRLCARFARRRLRLYPRPFGNTSAAVSIPLAQLENELELVERLLDRVGYRGIFSVEFKRDARDGELKLIEVNARPWWYVEFAASCGVDVCQLAYRDALGLPVEPIERYRAGRRSVQLTQDLRAMLQNRTRGRAALRPWLRSLLGADEAVFAWDDPLPAAGLVEGALRKSARSFRRNHPLERARLKGRRGEQHSLSRTPPS